MIPILYTNPPELRAQIADEPANVFGAIIKDTATGRILARGSRPSAAFPSDMTESVADAQYRQREPVECVS